MNTEEERQRGYQEHQHGSRERVDAEPARGHTEAAKGHAEIARSCAVPERASMGDVEAPEACAGLVGLTLGQRGSRKP